MSSSPKHVASKVSAERKVMLDPITSFDLITGLPQPDMRGFMPTKLTQEQQELNRLFDEAAENLREQRKARGLR